MVDENKVRRIKEALKEDVKYQKKEAQDSPEEFQKAYRQFIEEEHERLNSEPDTGGQDPDPPISPAGVGN